MVINTMLLDKFGWYIGYYYSYSHFCIEMDIKTGEYFFIDDRKPKKIKFVNNSELFSLIIKNNAFNTDYQRHFKINKILK